MLSTALEYHKAGLKVIPVYKADSGVRFPRWKHWSEGEPQTELDVKKLFSSPSWGLAILCTDGMEVIDIDVKADPTKTISEDYFNEVVFSTLDVDLLKTCVTIKTKSDGYHLVYRTNKAEGNQKLTVKNSSPEAVIETRGTGGLIFAAPTPGYKVLRGSYQDIKTLTDQQRDGLINSAKTLNEIEIIETPPTVNKTYSVKNEDTTPWDDYNNSHSVSEVIEGYGWTELVRSENSKYRYYSKPNSKSGDLHGVVVKSSDIFFTFSTATDFKEQKGYTAYAALTVLKYNGDFSACAKDLAYQGFGKKQESAREESPAVKVMTKDTFDSFEGTKFDYHADIKQVEATLVMHLNGKTYDLAGQGMIAGVLGAKKSGKSLLTALVMASRLSGKQQMVFEYKSKGKKVLYFDTEQSEFFYHRTQKLIYQMAGYRDNSPLYSAYCLRDGTPDQRVQFIDQKIKEAGNVELIVIDGLKDLCNDFNDITASAVTMQHLMTWSAMTGALIIPVLHTTKTGGYARGHLGTELENKYDLGFTVSKDEESHIFRVKHRDSRFAPFPSFEFERDENGFPFMDSGFVQDVEPIEEQKVYQASVSPANEEEEIPF